MENLEAAIEFIGGPAAIVVLAFVYFGSVIAERIWAMRGNPDYDNKDALCSIGLNLMASVIKLVIGVLVPLAIYILVYDNLRLFDGVPLLIAIAIAFIAHDLSYYWEHRLSHRVGLLWAFHAIHHSSNEFNHSTAARGFFLDGLPRPLFDSVAALCGVPPVVFIAVSVVKNAFGIWNHASYVGRLGWLDRWLATPMVHKVHHANQPQYIDKNYAQVLIVWDRLFASYAPVEQEPNPGLVKPTYDYNPITAQFVGLKQLMERMDTAERWQDKLGYLWRPPEWSHDGVCRSDCPKYANVEPA
ncbi:MAG: sterol desaturase family protein [Parvularcula sp.]|jgi:sterol desaturase/sphingolipid hydroxylase (fatty acid hydroxylase superfamily)|nr:sterol desaturase family protein [Parvularcula sp.]